MTRDYCEVAFLRVCALPWRVLIFFTGYSVPRFASKPLMIFPIHSESAVLVADSAYRPSGIQLVFQLNGLVLRRGHVGGKSDKQIAGDPLLNCDAGSGALLAAAQHRIDRQVGQAGKLLYPS